MQCVSLAETAVLLRLHTVGMSLLILCDIVISLLALGARESNLCTL